MSRNTIFIKYGIHPIIIISGGLLIGLIFLLAKIIFFNAGQPTVIRIDNKNILYFLLVINLAIVAVVAMIHTYLEMQQHYYQEKLQRHSLKNQFEELKQLINPHFLFNSLNILTQIINDNPAAIKYVMKLSKIYRHTLNRPNKKNLTLKEDLNFIETYLYILTERFKGKLNVSIIREERNSLNYYLGTISLQKVIDGIIQHSILSKRHPLQICIFLSRKKKLVIQYKLQSPVHLHAMQVFFEQLRQQDQVLGNEKIEQEIVEGLGIIQLPLIQRKNMEYYTAVSFLKETPIVQEV